MPFLKCIYQWKQENSNYNSYYGSKYYTNPDAVEKVIRYVTRTRQIEDRKNELIAIGGRGVYFNFSIEHIINQFLSMQNFYNINQRGGRRVFHEAYCLSDQDFINLNCDYANVYALAEKISDCYLQDRHQVLFAIHHDPEKKVHIHFVVNTVNYESGKKYHSSKEDLKRREKKFNEIFYAEVRNLLAERRM